MTIMSEPFKPNQLLVLPDGTIGRYLRVEEEDYQPAEPENGIPNPYFFCVIAVEVHGKVETVELADVTTVDEFPTAEEYE